MDSVIEDSIQSILTIEALESYDDATFCCNTVLSNFSKEHVITNGLCMIGSKLMRIII